MLDLNYGRGRGVVIFSKRLFIIVELLIILLIGCVILSLPRRVISHINILEESLLLFTVSLLNVCFNFSLHLLALISVSSSI